MEANHMLRNAFFSDLDLPKSNMFDFSLAKTMVGPLVATKEWDFYSPELLSFIATALGKFGSPALVALSVAKTDQKKQKDILRKDALQIFFLKHNDTKKFDKSGF